MAWWHDTYKYAKLVMSLLVQQLIFERQRDQERAESQRVIAGKDRELLLLRLDAKLVQYERRLPLAESQADDTL